MLNFTEASRHEVFLHNHVFHATLLREATLMATVQTVTTALGKQPQLPDWIMRGAILGVQRGTGEVSNQKYMYMESTYDVSASSVELCTTISVIRKTAYG